MKVADELGYNKCMLGEHFIVPQSHIELSGDHYFHTTVALGYIGGQTKQMKLSSSVSILPLQSPMVHATACSTLDCLTNGRADRTNVVDGKGVSDRVNLGGGRIIKTKTQNR